MVKKHPLVAVIVSVVLAVMLGIGLLTRFSSNETKTVPQATKSTSDQGEQVSKQEEVMQGQEGNELKKVAEQFIVLYTSNEPNQEKWLSDMKPYCTPELCESIRTSDRNIIRASSKTVTEVGEEQVRVEGGEYPYILHFFVVSKEENDGQALYLVDGIQYSEELDGKALPLDKRHKNKIRDAAKEVIRVVASQYKGVSDADREKEIRSVLKDPKQALEIGRLAASDHAVTIGDIHEISYYAADGSGLKVDVLFPYQIDRVQKTRWVGMSIFFERGESGRWIPVDAVQERRDN